MKKGHYTIIILAVGLVLFSGLLSIKDNRKRKIVVYNGNNLLINIDGKVATDLPTSGNYYLVKYNCDNKNTVVSWNHNSYDLTVSNEDKGGSVYCNLTFKSSPTLSEMPVGSYVDYTGVGGSVGSSSVACQVGGSASNSDGSVDTESPNSCKGQNAREDLDTSGYTYGYCTDSSYKYVTKGWRLAYVDGDKPVIVSAGSPECNSRTSSTNNEEYIKLANTRALKYCNSSLVDGTCSCPDSNSDGLCDSASTDAWAINENDFHLMIEQNMGKSNSYLYSNISSYNSCGNLEASEECGYNNDLFDNGGYYWFASTDSSGNGVNWVPGSRRVDETDSTASRGLRPMISLKSSIVVVGGSGTMEDPYQLNTEPLVDLVGSVMASNAKTDASIDFSKTSSASGTNGVYLRNGTENDTYPIYYYRGVVDNNLIFANFCWKIVRTTETGGIKLIYSGLSSDGKCNNTGADNYIGYNKFNSSYNNPAHVGYMYGSSYTTNSKRMDSDTTTYIYGNDVSYSDGTYTLTDGTIASNSWSNLYNGDLSNNHYTCFTTGSTCSTVYYIYSASANTAFYLELTNGKKIEAALSEMLDYNTNSSTVKGNNTTEGTLDYWYYNNLYTNHNSNIEDTVWCNDRSISDYGGWDPDSEDKYYLYFGSYGRNVTSHQPSFNCVRNVDKFTVNLNNGNGDLDYPIGLLTGDEYVFAGGCLGCSNMAYYLYNNDYNGEHTMSPYSFSSTNSMNIVSRGIDYEGLLEDGSVSNSLGIRPSISLREGVRISEVGDGTRDNPYVVNGFVDIEREKVTINFDLNGGESINFSSKDVVVGARYGNLPTPTKTGHTFEGWYTDASGGELVTSESKVNISENQTLYAHWTANQYTVTFVVNNASSSEYTISSTTKTVTYGSTYGELPTITFSYSYYNFYGWYTSDNGGGSQVNANTIVTITSDQTLYAFWDMDPDPGMNGDAGEAG